MSAAFPARCVVLYVGGVGERERVSPSKVPEEGCSMESIIPDTRLPHRLPVCSISRTCVVQHDPRGRSL